MSPIPDPTDLSCWKAIGLTRYMLTPNLTSITVLLFTQSSFFYPPIDILMSYSLYTRTLAMQPLGGIYSVISIIMMDVCAKPISMDKE